MRLWVRSALRWAIAPLWIAAIAGVWLLPVRVVVVLTGAAVADTVVSAVVADKSSTVDLLVDALARTQPRSLYVA